jgi:hypothetical protein
MALVRGAIGMAIGSQIAEILTFLWHRKDPIKNSVVLITSLLKHFTSSGWDGEEGGVGQAFRGTVVRGRK